MWAACFDLTHWNPNNWTIPLKTAKDLTDMPFDGDIGEFREWRELMRDHLLGANQGYGRIIWELENCKEPVTMNVLHANPTLPGMNLDLVWITRQLWTCMSRNVTRTFRESLKRLASGEELDGLELRRALSRDNEGGSVEVEIADLGAFHTCPPCPSSDQVMAYLGSGWPLPRTKARIYRRAM